MIGNPRQRRIDNEWALLAELARCNPGSLEVLSRSRDAAADFFRVTLHHTAALSGAPPHLQIVDSHGVEFRFPAWYPAVPVEAFLSVPVFHPNVHPDNGFVCLWTRGSTGDTILTALVRLQNVLGWRLHNASPDHLMQPEALAWLAASSSSDQLMHSEAPASAPVASPGELPLPCTPLEIPASLLLELNWRQPPSQFRRRLSDPD
jgi:ubiquitin-protein ligase